MSTTPAPHLAPPTRVSRVMLEVIAALIPAALAHLWFFGPGLLLNLISCITAACTVEWLAARAIGRPASLADGSAVLTAVLIAFCLPPLLPWWIGAFAGAVAVLVGKHLYGGLGQNLFNPAMVGYAAVLLCFPAWLTDFPPPRGLDGLSGPAVADTLRYFLLGATPVGFDAMTLATPLDHMQAELRQMRMVKEIAGDPRFAGPGAGPGWTAVSLTTLLGGGWLLLRKLTRWHAPVGVLAGVGMSALVLNLIAPDNNASMLFHLLAGGTVLGAFFIATDPVSGATSPRGRLLFGLGVGVLTVAIRSFGQYPDGIAFAVLLMNLLAPLVDRATRPRIYGHAG